MYVTRLSIIFRDINQTLPGILAKLASCKGFAMKKSLILLLLAIASSSAIAHEKNFNYTLKVRNGSDVQVGITCDNGATYDAVAAGSTQAITFSSGEELNLDCVAVGPDSQTMDRKRVHAHHRKPVVSWNVRHQHAAPQYYQR